jgi:hypothetical protein
MVYNATGVVDYMKEKELRLSKKMVSSVDMEEQMSEGV